MRYEFFLGGIRHKLIQGMLNSSMVMKPSSHGFFQPKEVGAVGDTGAPANTAGESDADTAPKTVIYSTSFAKTTKRQCDNYGKRDGAAGGGSSAVIGKEWEFESDLEYSNGAWHPYPGNNGRV
ncbi:hypothetical protein PC118_g16461 [Phytophthora cactorum]|uniref:Uncharacterized protein n=1 Tax=Phytophthora cactorum TaxID=29920 RepID=A0A8T1FGL1_9STRA|nr:hypothetical protein PC118_g16461 [Phytophthora cactorum]